MRVFHEEGVTARGQVLQMEMTGLHGLRLNKDYFFLPIPR
jgi:hypothetical protein